MENNKPLVSIIVRTKDRPVLLRRALQSIAEQDYRTVEVVLVNDGGCDLAIDEFREILGELSLNYVRLEENRGRAGAGNVGIENARGDYIGFLDDDDEFYPEHISTLVGFLNCSDYKVVHADTAIVSLSYNLERKKFLEITEDIFSSLDFSSAILLFENYIPLLSILLESEVLHDIGGFDEAFEIFEDWDLLIRISSVIPFHHIPKVTSKYTQWSRNYQIANVDWIKAKDYYIKVLAKHSERRTPENVYRYYINKEQIVNGKEKIIGDLREELAKLKKYPDYKKCFNEKIKCDNNAYIELLNNLERQLDEKDRYIEEIHNSIGWKILTFYRRRIKSLLAPPGSKREKLYSLGLRSLLLLKRSGFVFLFNKAKNVLRRIKAKRNIKKEEYVIPVIKDRLPESIDAKVSVVIPTKDAGPEFRYTLEKIYNQKGIKDIEVIVIDSDSNDNTVDIAEQYGAKIYFIDPLDFNHGATRNLGADKASGDFIIFMSQDVIPIGDFCIFNILSEMQKDGEIAAASVRQVPRSDADLFARWQLWYYNHKLLDLSRDRVVALGNNAFDIRSVLEKRRLVQLDNIFSCVRKNIFDKHRFNPLPYGEDLDLGVRLIKAGYKMLFLSSKGVIHSHNREPAYFFKRGYIDIKSLLRLLEYEPIEWENFGVLSMHDLLININSFYKKIKYTVSSMHSSDILNNPLDKLLSEVKSSIFNANNNVYYPGDKSLDELFALLLKKDDIIDEELLIKDDVLVNQYIESLDNFIEYLNISAINIYKDNADEFIAALYKLFAVTCGSNIGNYIVSLERKEEGIKNSYIENILGCAI